MNKRFFLLLAVFVALTLTGCSKGILITGTVKYSDGEPITKGQVVFDSSTSSFGGNIDADGNYKSGGLKPVEGIPPGTYKVWIRGTTVTDNTYDDDGKLLDYKVTETVSSQFTNPQNTKLTFEVKAGGPKTFDIVVERPEW